MLRLHKWAVSAVEHNRPKFTYHGPPEQRYRASACLRVFEKLSRNGQDLVALPGLEPGLSALRGQRVNQLHHNAMPVKGERPRVVPVYHRSAKLFVRAITPKSLSAQTAARRQSLY